MRTIVRFGIILAVVVFGSWLFAINQPGSAAAPNVVADQYIVALKPGEKPRGVTKQLAKSAGIEVRHIYENALNGFSARIPANKLEQVKSDPAVLSVVPDFKVFAFEDNSPSGIRRSEADRNAIAQIGSDTNPIMVDVAVLDTGIDANHPDLNVVGGISCVPGEPSWGDLHGHGTHVAGTIGALDNGSGVVGVAPGTRLWAVRVLDANGDGEFSDVLCGVDWVTAHADTIEVANMSLGGEAAVGSCTDGSLHQGICESVAAGVTYIVAAGNSGVDAGQFVPAAFDEVITVSALSDTDGKPGRLGSPSFYGGDDTLASFSNYGQVVDIAAPGVDILSTWPGGSYNTSSGTSMASPHVAGAAAIYHHQNPGASPASTRAHLLSVAWDQSSANGFSGDRDNYPEKLLNAGAVGGLDPLPPPPPPQAGCSASPESGTVSTPVSLTCAGFQSSEWVWVYWDSASSYARAVFIASAAGEGSVTVTIPDAPLGEHQIVAKGSSSGIEEAASFTVEPSLTLSIKSGAVGSYVAAYAKGFAAGEQVDLRWHSGAGSSTSIKTLTASSAGSASAFFPIPEAAQGTHTIEATGSQSGSVVGAEFIVVPGIKASPGLGRVGSSTTISVTGYVPGETVTLSWFDNASTSSQIASVVTNASGSASTSLTIPLSSGGNHVIEGIGSTGSSASTTFNVTASMAASSTGVAVGDDVTVELRGYASGETVELYWYDTWTASWVIDSVIVSAQGHAQLPLNIPEGVAGTHQLRAVGAASGSYAAIYFSIQPKIELTPSAGPAGSEITVQFTGFRGSDATEVRWYETGTSFVAVASGTTSPSGSMSASFNVPLEAVVGVYNVEGSSTSSYTRARAAFTLEAGPDAPASDCELSPASGVVGSSAVISCYGFEPREVVRVYWDSTSTTPRALFTATNGGGSTKVTIPDATAGEHLLLAVGSNSGTQVAVPFTVEASFKPLLASGSPGSLLMGYIKGFAASETVNIIWHGESTMVLKSVTTSSVGSALGSFYLPQAAGGSYQVSAIGQASGTRADATFTVTPGVKLSRTAGYIGTEVTAAIGGFELGEVVEVTWDSVSLGTITASQVGAGAVTFVVPDASKGSHTVTAAGPASGTVAATFTVYPSVTFSTTTVTVGTEVSATIKGFAGGEQIELQWYDTTSAFTTLVTTSADPFGSATLQFTVPEATNGVHKATVRGISSNAASSVYFIVSYDMQLSVNIGPANTEVNATVTGYRSGETVEIRWYVNSYSWVMLAATPTSSLGSAQVTFTVPQDATAGDHNVVAIGKSSYGQAKRTFTVE